MSTRSDIVGLLTIPLGTREAAEAKLFEIEGIVRDKAAEGVRLEIARQMPGLESKAVTTLRSVVQPFFIGAAGVGILSLLFGVIAMQRNKAKSP